MSRLMGCAGIESLVHEVLRYLVLLSRIDQFWNWRIQNIRYRSVIFVSGIFWFCLVFVGYSFVMWLQKKRDGWGCCASLLILFLHGSDLFIRVMFAACLVLDFKMTTIHEGLGRAGCKNIVCLFWKEGRCKRNPCKFFHGEFQAPAPTVYHRTLKQQSHASPKSWLRNSPYHSDVEVTKRSLSNSRKRVSSIAPADEIKISKKSLIGAAGTPLMNDPKPKNGFTSLGGGCGSDEKLSHECMNVVDVKRIEVQKDCLEYSPSISATVEDDVPIVVEKGQKACELWMSGSCGKGDQCQFLHSWYHGDRFSMLARLSGHTQAISGIALPTGSDKLYSGSSDGTVQVWDCHSGQSTKVMNLGDKIGSLISEGPWVFVGMANVVKAWNLETTADLNFTGPVGQVYAMAVAPNMLFAGVQNGAILVWKASTEKSNPFQLATSLKGHTSGVLSLAVGAMKLYSGSMDGKIRVWDLESLRCIQELDGHSNAVMSLVCSDQYLISCSLDHAIKIWFPSEGGELKMIYTHNMEHGVIGLAGVNDAEGKPILLCSCDDNHVQLYELPSFKDGGRIFTKEAASEIRMGPDGLFFIGDGSGSVTVWKFSKQCGAASCR